MEVKICDALTRRTGASRIISINAACGRFWTCASSCVTSASVKGSASSRAGATRLSSGQYSYSSLRPHQVKRVICSCLLSAKVHLEEYTGFRAETDATGKDMFTQFFALSGNASLSGSS